MSEAAAAAPADPGALIRSKSYRVLLVFAALIGVLVSFASWCRLPLSATVIVLLLTSKAGIASAPGALAETTRPAPGRLPGADGRDDHGP